eukprot:TRINITY_DN1852_c0_g2_i2.p2 TRINITY_DN1852_c0_g2~~TRINITY_DN1852_c0_g2_i2.p2  ORF type:complete len:492 (-),score=6.68 TRINITY_DN1852_c0_g2_i2:431-1741(-)
MCETSIGSSAACVEQPVSLFSITSCGTLIVVATFSKMLMIDLKREVQVEIQGQEEHLGCIRCIQFSLNGSLFFAGGDDKILRIWKKQCMDQSMDNKSVAADTELGFVYQCICKVITKKKICAGSFTKDGCFVFVGDKFGDVYVVQVPVSDNCTNNQATWVLGHYCAIIGAIDTYSNNRFVGSCDRDGRIRISYMSNSAKAKDYGIQAYCLGHVGYVAQICFLSCKLQNNYLLISAGQDGTLRSWNFLSGQQIDEITLNLQTTSDRPTNDNLQDHEVNYGSIAVSCVSAYYSSDACKFIIAVVYKQMQLSYINIIQCCKTGRFDQGVQSYTSLFAKETEVQQAKFDDNGSLWILGEQGCNRSNKRYVLVKGQWDQQQRIKFSRVSEQIGVLLQCGDFNIVQPRFLSGSNMVKRNIPQEQREERKANRKDQFLVSRNM